MPMTVLRAAGGVFLAAALSVGVLSGCKASGGSDDAAGSPSPSTTSSGPAKAGPAAPSQSASSSGSAIAPGEPAPPAGDLDSHRGTVTKGTEPGCMILRSSDGEYELVGANAKAKQALRPDAKVVVRGYQEKNMMSHCMQGKLFKVVSVKSAS
ncbi:MAG: hypothetical protein WCA46_06080 [Actinocatenispora sp.]